MKEFLRRLKLVDSMTIVLPTSRVEFVNRLKKITDEGSTGMMSDTFDIFSSSKNEFKGQVNFDNFQIKRKRKFFDTNMNSAVANGKLTENSSQLIVETEINGFKNLFIIFYALLIIFYSIFIVSLLSSESKGWFVALFFILLHGTIMFSIPYFMMRRSVKRLKYDLEREFFYLTKKQ